MAWPGQTDPKEILGMTKEELQAKLDGAASKQDIADQIAKLDAFNGTLSQIQESLKALTTPPLPEKKPDDLSDPTLDILTDPQKFIGKQLEPMQQVQLETQSQMQEMRARQDPQFANVFAQYGGELVDLAKKAPVAMRAGDGFWAWHIRTFLGDKFVKGELKQTSYPSLIGTSSVGVDSTGKPSDPNFGFDPEVAGYLKGRNIPLDKAQKIHQIMEVNGDPITLENYKRANA